MPRKYFVYILTNPANTVLYTGVTGNLRWRVSNYKQKTGSRFTARYNVNKLVYFEEYDNPRDAIAREKQIKGGPRQRKLELIRHLNPDWNDLYWKLSL